MFIDNEEAVKTVEAAAETTKAAAVATLGTNLVLSGAMS